MLQSPESYRYQNKPSQNFETVFWIKNREKNPRENFEKNL